jgi:hypothetical protein
MKVAGSIALVTGANRGLGASGASPIPAMYPSATPMVPHSILTADKMPITPKRGPYSMPIHALDHPSHWKAFNLQPHRTETFKLSADPLFVDKVRDIVGLYLAPPERALVLCVDEKSQIQTGPVPAAAAHATGTNRAAHPRLHAQRNPSLFAALDAATGKVIWRCYPRHRGCEFLAFLRENSRFV